MSTRLYLNSGMLIFCVMMLASSSNLIAESRQLYQIKMGPFPYAITREIELDDESRNKKLPIRITYPKEKTKHPIIIFSHGAMGSNEAYQPLVTYWASHGYVCIQPTHEDSLKLLLQKGKRFQLRNVWNKWNTRPPDIKLILDSLGKLEKQIPALKNKLDQQRIGMGGHSFGAHTSMIIGGARLKKPFSKRLISMADKRPKALLLISPQGTGQSFVPESWKTMTRPALIITGTKDKSPRNGKSYEWRKEVFENTPPGDCYLLMIEGAYHGFGGITGKTRFPRLGTGELRSRQLCSNDFTGILGLLLERATSSTDYTADRPRLQSNQSCRQFDLETKKPLSNLRGFDIFIQIAYSIGLILIWPSPDR